MRSPSAHRLRMARRVLQSGGVIAYPTEGVWGLGCDPANSSAVEAIFRLKGRAAAKGLILVAAEFRQLEPWLAPLDPESRSRVLPSWPGPVTWLLPARPSVPSWLRGRHATLAVRVSDHPVVQSLCRTAGMPLVSTSANRSGGHPAVSAFEVRRIFGKDIDLIVTGELGGRRRPSEIRDLSGRVLRPG
ncbi:L-threonylcarbamoyladenylate synthase [Thiohalomonas denitrificans]|uniref:Threonylcarbamoyl-AMP synthase n=2 Tax=Thiohalomonas denitrificans TaxID=415747 RepID=A0A1G5QS88_9GAMM|nr:Sua5/YciO/YrdC/YwlC family protein [Thiohalomonas denitrificans]SCZ64526.1 L-threonylcarbamoyladenylate synthase [Thiohalomonas denitrificans]